METISLQVYSLNLRRDASAILRWNQKKPAAPPTTDQSNLILLDPEAFVQTALELLSSDRYLQKGMGLSWPSPGAGLPRSSSAPPSASLEKNSPFPPSSSTANSKPGTSSEPYLIPVLADPRKLFQALDTLRS